MSPAESLENYLKAANEAALKAAVVLDYWREKFEVREKGRFDLVTEADVSSQKTIFEYLSSQFPTHEFLGEEEDAGAHRPGPQSPPTWIVDPIDGTTNYVHNCPFYCISIGLQVAGELVVGVVYDPTRKEMFSAAKGYGAWLGEQRLHCSRVESLGQGLIATGFPPAVEPGDPTIELFRHFSWKCQALRRIGSTALNLAYVAAGRFDGYYAFDNFPWDVAGGVVLVQEAGGMLSNTDGSEYDPYTNDAIASNGGPIHDQILEEIKVGKK